MDLDRASLQRLQEFVACVDWTMNQIPRTAPPPPEPTWDGLVLPTGPLSLSFRRLPPRLQMVAARGYALCLHALAAQTDIAEAAQLARHTVFGDLVQTGLTADHLCPDPYDHGDTPSGYRTARRTLVTPTASGVSAAAALLLWPRSPSAPAATTAPPCPATADASADTPAAPIAPAASGDGSAFTIDRTASDGDLTVIVSHGERVGARTRYHVHMVNAAEQPRRADITVHDGDRDTAQPPELIPPRSSRHRVIEVADSHGESVSLSVGGIRVDNLLDGQ